MHTVDGVLSVLAEIVRPVSSTPASLDDARGQVLAQAVRMDQDSPPFDRSQLDGFAIVATPGQTGGELEVVGRVDAGGALFAGTLVPGQCVAINTGGVMPAGADAVLMVEHAEAFTREKSSWVKFTRPIAAGYGIQRKGSDARAGDIVLEAGTRLGPAQLAVCATAGVWAPAIRAVNVALLSTGDELIDGPAGADAPAPGRIRNSNGPMLRALIADAGGRVLDMGNCRDEVVALRAVLTRALNEADLLVVCGGMSMGTRDFVPGLLKELGVAIHVEKVRMKPGKPFIFGALQRDGKTKYVAGLPGNPVSAYVTFQRFVRDAIGRMAGATEHGLRAFKARTILPLEENGEREFFQPCRLLAGDVAGMQAEVLQWKGSADLFTIARAAGLVVRPAGAPAVRAGEVVDVLAW